MAMEGSKTFNPDSTTFTFLSSNAENKNSQACTYIQKDSLTKLKQNYKSKTIIKYYLKRQLYKQDAYKNCNYSNYSKYI